MPRNDQPNLDRLQHMAPDVASVDTGDTDPISGLALRTGTPRLAVDLRQLVQLLDWGQ